jgi:hypothetical protein
MKRASRAVPVVGLVLVLLATSATTLAGADAPPERILERFLGSWMTEAVIRNSGPPAREIRSRGRAECRRTLADRYVEFRSASIDPPGVVELQVMTYDAEAGLYRQWVFDSEGYRHEAVGRWNAATSTLRWEGRVDGVSIVIDDHWVSRDRLEWTLTRTAADGRVVQRIDGVVSREGRRPSRP